VSITTDTYVRKPIYVNAVQVTEENFDAIAGWCGGEIKETINLRNRTVKYIHVPVTRPQTERQEQARVGDWILTSERGYKVYTPKAFTVAFDKVNEVKAQSYPYPDGDVTVLGPEVFAGTGENAKGSHTADPSTHDTISWKGENYYTFDRASELMVTTKVNSSASFVPAAICNKCGAPKGLQVVGESCNNNCGGSVVVNPQADGRNLEQDAVEVLEAAGWTVTNDAFVPPNSDQPVPDTDAQEEVIAKRRVQEADIRNRAATGQIKAEEAEMEIRHLPPVNVQPVGTLPMPKQDLGDAGLPESAVASPPTEAPKAADVWARVELGEITGEQARAILGQPVIAATAVPVAAPVTAVVPQEEPAVGTQPMPEQPEPTDVEVRERPPALPPHMQSGGHAENVETGERTEAVHIPVETEIVAHTNAEVAALKAEQGIPSIENNTNEGAVQHMSTPEDPSTHTGVDLSEDEALKAGIDLTDETALKAADEDEQLAADAMKED